MRATPPPVAPYSPPASTPFTTACKRLPGPCDWLAVGSHSPTGVPMQVPWRGQHAHGGSTVGIP
eukprot:821777-Prymnesium_polylepis.1